MSKLFKKDSLLDWHNLLGSTNSDLSQKYLSFFLGEYEFAVNIYNVVSIISWKDASKIVQYSEKGLANLVLNGKSISIFDLYSLFSLTKKEINKNSVIIVLAVKNSIFAVLADGSSELYILNDEQIKPLSLLPNKISIKYLKGEVNFSENLVYLLDTLQILNEYKRSKIYCSS